MTRNTISFVQRLIWKRFRWNFIDTFEDVCSLHTCFSADSLHLLCCIMPCESSGRFFWATRYISLFRHFHTVHRESSEACFCLNNLKYLAAVKVMKLKANYVEHFKCQHSNSPVGCVIPRNVCAEIDFFCLRGFIRTPVDRKIWVAHFLFISSVL